jgi:hypothetical protein
MPDHLPALSGAEKPAIPSLTPQTSEPRALMASSVGPAAAAEQSAVETASVVKNILIIIPSMKPGISRKIFALKIASICPLSVLASASDDDFLQVCFIRNGNHSPGQAAVKWFSL